MHLFSDEPSNSGNQLPSMDDFSSSSVKKAVRSESLFHPVTLYSTSLGLLAGLGCFLFAEQRLILAVGTVVLLGLGAGMAAVNMFFRGDVIARKYLDTLSSRFAKEREYMLQSLCGDLKECIQIKGAEQYSAQAQQQYRFIEDRYTKFKTMLAHKLNQGELTYARFLGAAEQVYLGGLDTLRRIVVLLQSVNTIDPEYIAMRLAELNRLTQPEKADEREFATLKNRLELREQQLQQINQLLTDNEESMTVMSHTVATVAQMRTHGGLASMELDAAMDNLRELAGRTYHTD
jgi:hypothetical protein